MCNPGFLMMGLGIGTSILGRFMDYRAQQSAANDQRRYQLQMMQQQQAYQQEVARQANAAYQQQVAQLQLRQEEEDVKAANEAAKINREWMLANSRAKVGAGEAGVSGVSVDMLLNDYARQRDVYIDSIKQSREFGRRQASAEAEGFRLEAMGRPRQVQQYIPSPTLSPSLGVAALGMLSDTVGIFGRQSSTTQRALFGKMPWSRPSIQSPYRVGLSGLE